MTGMRHSSTWNLVARTTVKEWLLGRQLLLCTEVQRRYNKNNLSNINTSYSEEMLKNSMASWAYNYQTLTKIIVQNQNLETTRIYFNCMESSPIWQIWHHLPWPMCRYQKTWSSKKSGNPQVRTVHNSLLTTDVPLLNLLAMLRYIS